MTERRKEEASEKAEEWFKNVSYVSLNKNAHLFSSRGMCYPAWDGTQTIHCSDSGFPLTNWFILYPVSKPK